MKPSIKGQVPHGLRNLCLFLPSSKALGLASVSVFSDMAPAKIPEECPGEDLRCGWLSVVCLGGSERFMHRGF